MRSLTDDELLADEPWFGLLGVELDEVEDNE